MSDTQKHTKPNVPNLRFPGFEGEWEVRKIGSMVDIRSGISPTGIVDFQGTIPYYKVEQLNNCFIELGETPYLAKEGSIPAYSIVFPKRGAAIMTNKIRLSSHPCQLDTNLMALTVKDEKVDYRYLFYYLQRCQLSKIADTSTIPQINNIHINPILVHLPSMLEQRKISSFLYSMDKKVEIQIKVIEDYISLGQEVVNHVFSNLHIATVKLADICNRITERNTKQQSNIVLTISAKEGLVSQIDYFNKSVASENLSNYYLLHKGDFAYNKSYSSDHPWGAVKHLERFSDGVLSPLYFCFRPKGELIDADYLQLYFDTALWYKHISEIAVEGARNHGLLNMSVADFYRMPIPLPPLCEQRTIARKLTVFKQKLETEQNILRAFQNQKQFLLNQLFI